MILASWEVYEVGEVVQTKGVSDHTGNVVVDQPICILRAATYEQWRGAVIEAGGVPFLHPNAKYFYEVSTD